MERERCCYRLVIKCCRLFLRLQVNLNIIVVVVVIRRGNCNKALLHVCQLCLISSLWVVVSVLVFFTIADGVV